MKNLHVQKHVTFHVEDHLNLQAEKSSGPFNHLFQEDLISSN